ncbi:MAG: PKD domain-containing protein [Crocinitomicaceae bacterium]|nr:PKD domain-containing protein [Crocinitomicaceae bacterium]
MKTHWKSSCLLIFLLLQLNVNAQIDTLFWFAPPEVSASVGESPLYLRILTYDNAANITVTQPANGAFTPINLAIPANSVDSINLTAFIASIESPAGNAVANNGLKIVSDENVSVFYELKSASNKEIFTLKGNKALGDNFYTPFQNFWDNGGTAPASFSSIDIVATEDNTTVLITPRTDITGHLQDVSFSIVLQEGETYSARDMNTTGASTLAGSIVSSNKPIALTLFNGALSQGTCMSTIGDQITTEAYVGTEYIVHSGTSGNDRVYILATQNGTALTIENSGTTSTLINWGETYEIALSDAINYISASKPVYVWHASGYGCELSGSQVPSMVCAGTYESSFTRTSGDSLGIILYTRTGFEGQFALNGNASLIPPGAFSNVPGTAGAYKVAVIHYSTADVPVNSYNKVTNAGDVFGLGVLYGNDGNGSGYGYMSEFNSYPFVDAGLNDTICANTSLNLTGLVGGGSVTGIWSSNGFGAFSSTNDVLLNEYVPSPLDTLISPIELILTSTGPCPVLKDTLFLQVDPAPIVSASADQAVCENNAVVQLAGTVSGGSTTGGWSTLGTGTFSPDTMTLAASYIPSAADLTNGNVQLVLTSTNVGSCVIETDTVVITFTISATVDAGADTIYVCENAPDVGLMGTVTGVTTTGKWLSSGNGVFSPDNQDLNATYQPSPQDITNGSVWIYLESTSNNDCIPVTDSLLVIFTVPPTVSAGANILACTNDVSVDLSGAISGATTTGEWTGGAGTYAPSDTDLITSYSPTAGEISSGTVFLTLTSTNNGTCLAENDLIQISFVAPPIANFNFTEDCLYNPSVFTDFSLPGYGNITSWDWDFGDNSTSVAQDDVHTYANAGTFDVMLTVTSDVGCSDSLLQQVEVYEIPVAAFSYVSDCANNQIIVNFTDESTTNTDAINYWFYDFGGQGSQAVEDPNQLFTADGDYNIVHIVGTVNGCYDTVSQTLTVPPNPVADFTFNMSNNSNLVADVNFINNSSDASSFVWIFGDGTSSTEENPTNTYTDNGSYFVTLYATGALGCTDSVTNLVNITTIVEPEDINTLIPNAISPNNDGKNDVWKLEFISQYPSARIDIFNEWGQLIFGSDGYDIPWDGTYKGELVSDGTYYYVINLNETGADSELFKGTILVLKSKNK